MATDSITRSVVAEAERLGLSDIELAAVLGCSLPSATALLRGRSARTTRLKRAAVAFLVRAKRARSRADLTLPTAA